MGALQERARRRVQRCSLQCPVPTVREEGPSDPIARDLRPVTLPAKGPILEGTEELQGGGRDDRRIRPPDRPGCSHRARRGSRRGGPGVNRSEEHTSELQSLMSNSYAAFCLKKKK